MAGKSFASPRRWSDLTLANEIRDPFCWADSLQGFLASCVSKALTIDIAHGSKQQLPEFCIKVQTFCGRVSNVQWLYAPRTTRRNKCCSYIHRARWEGRGSIAWSLPREHLQALASITVTLLSLHYELLKDYHDARDNRYSFEYRRVGVDERANHVFGCYRLIILLTYMLSAQVKSIPHRRN
jgi:hypothetical protein